MSIKTDVKVAQLEKQVAELIKRIEKLESKGSGRGKKQA